MSILDGIGRTFKSIVKSPSKLLLASAAVYLGGSAMGWWESPFESINGAWADSGAGTSGPTDSGAGALAASERMPSAAPSGGPAEMINLMGQGATNGGGAEGVAQSA